MAVAVATVMRGQPEEADAYCGGAGAMVGAAYAADGHPLSHHPEAIAPRRANVGGGSYMSTAVSGNAWRAPEPLSRARVVCRPSA